jgi:hypothetical protein
MTRTLNGFAEACYNQNSIAELINALRGEPDEADCKEWNMSRQDWRDAIADALSVRLDDEDAP